MAIPISFCASMPPSLEHSPRLARALLTAVRDQRADVFAPALVGIPTHVRGRCQVTQRCRPTTQGAWFGCLMRPGQAVRLMLQPR